MPITDPAILELVDEIKNNETLQAELSRLRDLLAERDELIAAQAAEIELKSDAVFAVNKMAIERWDKLDKVKKELDRLRLLATNAAATAPVHPTGEFGEAIRELGQWLDYPGY